jgi:hypothetical protein
VLLIDVFISVVSVRIEMLVAPFWCLYTQGMKCIYPFDPGNFSEWARMPL